LLSTDLTPIDSKLVKALYVTKAPIVIKYELFGTLELDNHTLFRDRIIDVKVEKGLKAGSGSLDIFKVDPTIYSTPSVVIIRSVPQWAKPTPSAKP